MSRARFADILRLFVANDVEFVGVARLQFMTAKPMPEDCEKRKGLFGGCRDGTQPLSACNRDVEGKQVLELPVATLPLGAQASRTRAVGRLPTGSLF